MTRENNTRRTWTIVGVSLLAVIAVVGAVLGIRALLDNGPDEAAPTTSESATADPTPTEDADPTPSDTATTTPSPEDGVVESMQCEEALPLERVREFVSAAGDDASAVVEIADTSSLTVENEFSVDGPDPAASAPESGRFCWIGTENTGQVSVVLTVAEVTPEERNDLLAALREMGEFTEGETPGGVTLTREVTDAMPAGGRTYVLTSDLVVLVQTTLSTDDSLTLATEAFTYLSSLRSGL